MGTTLTAAFVGNDEVAFAHVGYSRAYRFREGNLEQLDYRLVHAGNGDQGLEFTARRNSWGPNYLRLGLYRGKGVPTVNHVFLDEVRIGDSYQAVAP